MQAILIETGLADARLAAAHGRPTARPGRIERRPAQGAAGDRRRRSSTALRAFGRRNLPLRDVPGPGPPGDRPQARPARPAAALPRRGRGRRPLALHGRGARSVPGRPGAPESADGDGDAGDRRPEADRADGDVTELHEVRTLNKYLARLRDEFGMRADVLLPRRGHRRRAARPVRPAPRRRRAPAARPPRPGADGPPARREGDQDHPVQGAGRDGRRAALGDHHGPDPRGPSCRSASTTSPPPTTCSPP